jgi:DNA-binding CsgD family transcriptional regulator/PAS domain-containing protein
MHALLLNALIGHLYDAAGNAALWKGVAARIAETFESSSAVVKLHGGSGRFQLLDSTQNLIAPAGKQEWVDEWHRRDLWVERSVAFGMERVVTSDDLVTPEEQRRSGFYQEWLKALDIHHMVGVVFPGGEGAVGVLGIHRPAAAGPYGDDDRAKVSLLLPHLQRAISLSQRLEDAELARATSLAALDRLETGVIALGEGGRILHVNLRAEAILAGDAGVGVKGGRLSLSQPALQERLMAALQACLQTANGKLLPPAAAFAVPRAGRLPLTLMLAPLRAAPAAGMTGGRPLVLVFLRDPERGGARADVLRALFGLTATEAVVAAGLAAGLPLELIAAQQSVALGTVRWHVKHVLAKTGAKKQSEAVAVLTRSVAMLSG